MTKETMFKNMEILIERLRESLKTGVIKFKDHDEKLLLKEIYKHIFPKAHVDLVCHTCVKNYLNIIWSYYHREYPKWLATQQDESTPITVAKEEDIVNAMTMTEGQEIIVLGKMTFPLHDEQKIEKAKVKLSRAEILQKARAARKQDQKKNGDA